MRNVNIGYNITWSHMIAKLTLYATNMDVKKSCSNECFFFQFTMLNVTVSDKVYTRCEKRFPNFNYVHTNTFLFCSIWFTGDLQILNSC